MAITQVTTVTVDGVVIGLSDTIDNLIQAGEFTIANLIPYMIVGQKTVGDQYYASLSAAERNYTGSGGSTPEWFPVNNTGRLGNVTVEFQTKDGVSLPHIAYGRNFLVHGTLNIGGEPQQIRADNMSASDLRVVTSIDYKKIYYDVEMAASVYTFDSPAGNVTYYQTGSQGCVRTIDNDEDAQCFVYSIFGDDSDWYCIKDWMFPSDDSANNTWHMSNSQSISGNFESTNSSLGTGYTNYSTTKTMFRWINNQVGAIYGGGSWNWNNSGHLVTVNGDIVQACDYSGSGVYAGGCYNIIGGLDNALKQLANAGLKFKWNNTWYKPISDGGIVTGYTDDMTEESDWDDIVNVTGNTVPVTPTPPVPPTPEGDDMDVMNTGATGSSGGFTHFYIMSPQDLIDLLADFYARADAGETLSNNLVCSYILGIPSSAWAATESVPVAIHNSAQGTPFVSNDNYNHVTATNNMLVTGTFDVPRMTNTFYDFSPYSTYEVFIPCCGWVRLPDTVAGRTINVYLYLDIASCCVKGQVMISGAGVCAVVNGALGSPIPMAVIESGILRGNNIQAGMGIIGGAIQTGVSAGNGNSMGIGLGAERILSGLVNCTVAGNTNYTEQKGGTGDITQFAMGHQCYMKITHPEIDPVVNEYIFGHTVGYLCNTVGQLSNFHGFTMCSNPHINISASDKEREEIKQFLEQGVILPSGE